MPTLLANRRMDPALRARVEASVRGERASAGRGLSPRAVVVVRAAVVLAIAAAVGVLAVGRRRDGERFDREKGAVVAALRAERATLGDADRSAVARVHAALVGLGGDYPGDAIDASLRSRAALDAHLARPAVWVRGPIAAFGSSAGISRAAAESAHNPLLFCLVDPPASRAERSVLGKVRAARAPGVFEERAPAARRLGDAEHALAILSPAFETKVLAAGDQRELSVRKAEMDRIPLARARSALRASIVIAAADEDGAPGTPAELDGERPHDVRLVIVDLDAGHVLVRLRRRVEPSEWSQGARAEHAIGLDGCAFAFAAREAITASR